MTVQESFRLTSLAHGGGCGCKIAPGLLSQILRDQASAIVPPELLVGLASSDDAAVYQLNPQQALIATTDFFTPIVDNPHDFGRIAASNALSDIYAMGGQPIFALAITGMPIDKLAPEVIREILAGGQQVCQQAGIPIAGGHSIDTAEPIYGLVVLGLAHPDQIKRNSSAEAGDVLVLSKPLGIGLYSAALKRGLLSDADYQTLLGYTTQLNRPGTALAQLSEVHALTDVTGFGLLGHLLEIARGSGLSASIQYSRLPLLSRATEFATQGVITGASRRNWQSYGEAIDLAEALTESQRAILCDPQTSGGLLISCAPACLNQVSELLQQQGFSEAAVIGTMRKPDLNTTNSRIEVSE